MKKVLFILLTIGFLGIGIASACANIYTFTPPAGSALDGDLIHQSYYSWGIDWNLPSDEEIVSAQFTYYNIIDSQTDKKDALFTTLLDNPGIRLTSGGKKVYVTTGSDTDATNTTPASNAFQAQINNGTGALVGTWMPNNGVADPHYNTTTHNLVYSFDSALLNSLISYLTTPSTLIPLTANFGFGIDPDCHYSKNGIEFKIVTRHKPIPEPATLALFGAGLAGLVFRRKK